MKQLADREKRARDEMERLSTECQTMQQQCVKMRADSKRIEFYENQLEVRTNNHNAVTVTTLFRSNSSKSNSLKRLG